MLYSHLKMNHDIAFWKACERGDQQTIVRVLPQIKHVDIANEKGWTGLIMAVFNEHYQVAKFLVANGANVNATNLKGTTVFMYAKTPVLVSRDTKILDWLLNMGANINAKDKKASLTVLDYVKQQNALWLEKWLRQKGAKLASELE
ncbi:ankyrin repeat domain-containing protein [Flagellimonas aequoris]|uniref:Ankyrin repeat domain-containing protein n=2 Tax=Flagellimonas aequoris TaxID=2306997 RepID=A0A418NAR8_9FLAO|nr:ankyrin repeat domain-containing protein [Allomuricauda aequoris]TXK05058.1 ankyrin repeat domain-containing protein [Allomuricauda aequoris]